MRIRAAHKDPLTIARGTETLREMTELSVSLRHATLLTDDGFEVVSLPNHRADGRLASMASSIQALSEAVAGELRIGDSQYVIIAAERGHVIQLRVPGHQLVLAGLFDDDETLGKALSTSRSAAERLAAALTSP
jgi:uncharacterized protein